MKRRVSHLGEIMKLESHHRDPFDRILIAQAVIEDLTVVTMMLFSKNIP